MSKLYVPHTDCFSAARSSLSEVPNTTAITYNQVLTAVCSPHSEVPNTSSDKASYFPLLYVPLFQRLPTAPSVETPQIQFSRNFVSDKNPHIEGKQLP